MAHTFSLFYHFSISIAQCIRNSCSLVSSAKLLHIGYNAPPAFKCHKVESGSGIRNTVQMDPLKPLQANTQESGVQGLGLKFLTTKAAALRRLSCHISSTYWSISKCLTQDKGNFCPLPGTPMPTVIIFSPVHLPARAGTMHWLVLSDESTSCLPR